MYINGRLGQVAGPFDAGIDLLADGGAISEFTPETNAPTLSKLGIQTTAGSTILINGVGVKLGKTGIYELDKVVNIESLIFPLGADANTIVDFIY